MVSTNISLFVIVKKTNGSYQFSFRSVDRRAILISDEYPCLESCEGGIATVKVNSQDKSNFVLLTSSTGEFYFILKTKNGKIIGKSKTYNSMIACFFGIASVRSYASEAFIEGD